MADWATAAALVIIGLILWISKPSTETSYPRQAVSNELDFPLGLKALVGGYVSTHKWIIFHSPSPLATIVALATIAFFFCGFDFCEIGGLATWLCSFQQPLNSSSFLGLVASVIVTYSCTFFLEQQFDSKTSAFFLSLLLMGCQFSSRLAGYVINGDSQDGHHCWRGPELLCVSMLVIIMRSNPRIETSFFSIPPRFKLSIPVETRWFLATLAVFPLTFYRIVAFPNHQQKHTSLALLIAALWGLILSFRAKRFDVLNRRSAASAVTLILLYTGLAFKPFAIIYIPSYSDFLTWQVFSTKWWSDNTIQAPDTFLSISSSKIGEDDLYLICLGFVLFGAPLMMACTSKRCQGLWYCIGAAISYILAANMSLQVKLPSSGFMLTAASMASFLLLIPRLFAE